MLAQQYIREYCSLLLYGVTADWKEVFSRINNGHLYIIMHFYTENLCALYELPVKWLTKSVNKIFYNKV